MAMVNEARPDRHVTTKTSHPGQAKRSQRKREIQREKREKRAAQAKEQ